MSRPVTLKEVALRAGVSTITASRAINGGGAGLPVSPATRVRVEAAATALGYRPHANGRSLRDRRNGQVGALVINNPDQPLTNPSAYEYLLGINAGLAETGLLLVLVRIDDVQRPDAPAIRALSERLLDGFIAVSRMPDAVTARLQQLGEPLVWLDGNHRPLRASVHRDEIAAGREAAGMLLRAGRRRIVWLQRPQAMIQHYSLADRETGARAACRAARAEFVEFNGSPGMGITNPQALQRELAQPGTGLLLADPHQVRWASVFLASCGLLPGRDLGVAACDCDGQTESTWSGLSRVEHNRHAMGIRAAGMAAALVRGDGAMPSWTADLHVVPGVTS
jgi:DNA-binding LacI/PurR family transcriptional regulator